MSKRVKKLSLNRETLRVLQDSELRYVVGGAHGGLVMRVQDLSGDGAKDSVCVCHLPDVSVGAAPGRREILP